MSTGGAAKLAVIRDQQDQQDSAAVTKGDIGKPVTKPGDDLANWRDVLATLIPSEVIAGYTALLALVVADSTVQDDPSLEGPIFWTRVVLFLVFLVLTALVVWSKYNNNSDHVNNQRRRKPPEEVVLSCLAFFGWALAAPGTFLTDLPGIAGLPTFLKSVIVAGIVIVLGIVLGTRSKALTSKLPA